MSTIASLAYADPVAWAAGKASQAGEALANRASQLRENAAGPILVLFIVSIAVLLALAAVISLAVVIFCATKGMNFEWYVKTSWFEVRVACSTG